VTVRAERPHHGRNTRRRDAGHHGLPLAIGLGDRLRAFPFCAAPPFYAALLAARIPARIPARRRRYAPVVFWAARARFTEALSLWTKTHANRRDSMLIISSGS